jgi:hypothetical protein
MGQLAILTGGITATGGALLAMSLKAAQAGTEIYEASEKTGISAEKLSGLRINAKLLGESFDSVVMAVGRVERNIATGLGDSSSKAGKDLRELMGSAQAVTKFGLLPMEDRVALVTKRIFEMTDVGERNRLLIEFFGRGALQNMSILQKLAEEGYDPAIARAKQFGQFFTPEKAAEMRQYLVEYQSAKANLEGISMVIGAKTIPAFGQLMGLIAGNAFMTEEFVDELKLLSLGLAAQVTSATNFFGMNNKALDALAAQATDIETHRLTAMKRFQAEMAAFAAAVKGATGAFEDQAKVVKDSTWQTEKMVTAIHQFSDLEKQLQTQLDAGTVPSLKRYLEANEKINEIARTGLNVYGLQRLNQLIFEKQRTDELREGMEKLNAEVVKHLPSLAAIIAQTGEWSKADTKLTDATRALLPLLQDETTTLARLRGAAETNVRFAISAQLPAMKQIELHYERERAAAKRALEEVRRDYAERRASLADLDRAEADHRATQRAIDDAEMLAKRAKKIAMAEDMAMEVAGLLQTLGLRRAAAIVEAVWETARSIQSFASLDFYGGTMHALAAAQFYVVAAKAGGGAAAYSAGGGGGVGTTAGAGGGRGAAPPALAPGAAGGGRFGEGGLTVIFQGPVYGGRAGVQELVQHISYAVERLDAHLVATRAKKPIYQGGGG